jgi:hypothetical protein
MAANARRAGLMFDRPRAIEAYRDVLNEVTA